MDVEVFADNGGCGCNPYRLVNLMEVLEFFAHGYCSIMASLGQLACQLRGMAAGATFSGDPYEKIGLALGALQREATTLNLPASKKQVQRLLDTINKHGHVNVSDEQIAIAILGIIERTVDELEERTFLLIPKETAHLFLDGQPFGAKVEAKFSSFTEDITEASRCLSLNRSTATVFHLMRVMERAGRSRVGYDSSGAKC